MRLIVLICFYFVLNFTNSKPAISVRKCGYEGCPPTPTDKINIHLIPHTHDDVGWLKTVDQYYYGSRTQYQKAGVQYILDSVIDELLKDSKRRFVYVESAFFFKWWDEQSEELQKKVKQLVNEGKLEFIGGAWSMNDEATTHYQSIVDQFSWGLRKLNETFGECGRPKIGWQIDPFGHSREMASIFAQMGYDGLFFARLDYEDKTSRMVDRKLEIVWHGSRNLGNMADLFTGVLYNHYSSPPGFCFDILCNDEPFIDGKHSPEYNVELKLDAFFHHIKKMSQFYRTNNLMIPMGDDFTYQDANMWYKNMDKLIKYGNAASEFNETKFNIFYSTPSCYLKSLYDANIYWPTKSFDFFPYSTDPHTFWSGFYTSRPTLKRFERITNHFLQICKQLTAILQIKENSSSSLKNNLNYLREVMGIMQHHDAITGTEKAHVAHDYERLMSEGISLCTKNTKKALRKLMNVENTAFTYQFESCPRLNISACELSENSRDFMITLYNPLSREENQFVRIPVEDGVYEISDSKGNVILSEMIPIPAPVRQIPYRLSKSQYELIFKAENVPAKGYDTFFVSRQNSLNFIEKDPEVKLIRNERQLSNWNEYERIIRNKNIVLLFDEHGFLFSVSINGTTNQIRQEFLYYEAAVGDNSIFENRSSGAYIFRPKPNTTAHKVTDKVKLEIIRGKFVQEVHQIFNEWISQVIRIYEDELYIEFEWLVGPIPVEGSIGKEIISRFTTDIQSLDAFETDSNGREMVMRIRNKREGFVPTLGEEISGNYYPVTTKISISDNKTKLSILTDRAQGGSSLENGVVELMVHRRLLHDDAFGVNEALNEVAYGRGIIARGKHYLYLCGAKSREREYERHLQLKVHLPLWTFFSNSTRLVIDKSLVYKYESVFSTSLPPNVNLMTIEPWGDDQLLLRYENILEKEYSLNPNNPTIFNIKNLFDRLNGIELRETTLDGNQWLNDMHRLKFNTQNIFNAFENIVEYDFRTTVPFHIVRQHEELAFEDFDIALYPMQIRTFILKYKNNL